MTFQKLAYFVAVVEEGNFTKAAQRCYVTQPALSRAIAELECELERPLLIRNGKEVEVTHAGRVCYEEARRILKRCETMVKRVQGDADDASGAVHLGYLFNGSLNFFADRLRKVCKLYPNVEVRTTYEHFKDAKRMLNSGELDLVLLAEPSAKGLGDVELATVANGGLYVVVHDAHPLFEKQSVTFEEIRDETFMFWDKVELPYLYRECMEAFHAHGIEPKVVDYGKKLGDMFAFVTLKEGLGLTTHAASGESSNVVHIIPISDCTTGFGIKLARLKDGENPVAASFFAHFKLMEP